MYQTITRKGSFDAAHRVMHERVKCYNLHGHTFLYELTFAFREPEDLGYALDFKEIKRVACEYIDKVFDHTLIVNPKDTKCIRLCEDLGTKCYIMSLNGKGVDCNPSAEAISKELFVQVSTLMNTDNFWLEKVTLYETPNCCVETTKQCISENDWRNVQVAHAEQLHSFRSEKGAFEYDERKVNKVNV